jgi:hypothetical protein
VVARLANRHGVRVELRPSHERGTVADVTLPSAVLVPRAVSGGRLQAGVGGPPAFGGRDDTAVPQRSPFGAPLALESGPSRPTSGAAFGSPYEPAGRPFDPNPPLNDGGMLGAGGRSVPAWSDLTGAGAANGTNGNGTNGNGTNGNGTNGNGGPNGFLGPQRPSAFPTSGGGLGDLPRRRADSFDDGSGHAGPIPRQLPANPEHHFRGGPAVPPVSAPPVPPVSAPPIPPVSAPPLPSRPVSGPPVSAPPVASGPPAPSAPPHPSLVSPSGSYPVVPPASRPPSPPPARPQPGAQQPQPGPQPSGQQSGPQSGAQQPGGPQAAPPAWPPVAAPSSPAVPESLAAALDMTAEIPRVRPTDAGSPGQPPKVGPVDRQPNEQRSAAKQAAAAAHQAAANQAAAAQQAAAEQTAAAKRASAETQARISDETMELPIFRELESAWFRTQRTDDGGKAPANGSGGAGSGGANGPNGAAGSNGSTGAVKAQRYSTAQQPARPAAVPQQAQPADSGNGTRRADTAAARAGGPASSPWQTAADEGWQAARAAESTVASANTTTPAGLPKRTPMAQLVPGGVDRGGPSVQRRTPEAVRGLLSAYHRGVQRGRSKDQSTASEETPSGQSSQAGKEHEE